MRVVQELRDTCKFASLLRAAGISKQLYYYEIKHRNDKVEKDNFYKNLLIKHFNKNYKKYGVPRITLSINKELTSMGLKSINHKKVFRLMSELGLKARPKQRKYKSYKGDIGKIAPNILNRDFVANRPYQKLGTDLTMFIMPFGKLYLSPIIDFYTREILAYDLSETPDFGQIIRMFRNLKKEHYENFKGAILHSDQGWQYQISRYRNKLKEFDIVQSMSRKGNCLDNSPTENFFGRLKEEMFYGKEHLYKNMDSLKHEIHKYIIYYNNKRIVRRLKMSPIEYRISNFGML